MSMIPLTLEGVLTHAEALPVEERIMLEELLRGRRIDAWRRETAAAAKGAASAFRSGQLKARTADEVIACLRAGKSDA